MLLVHHVSKLLCFIMIFRDVTQIAHQPYISVLCPNIPPIYKRNFIEFLIVQLLQKRQTYKLE